MCGGLKILLPLQCKQNTKPKLTIMAKKWRCTVCGYIHEGPEAPDQCPMCKVGKDKFVEVVEQDLSLIHI